MALKNESLAPACFFLIRPIYVKLIGCWGNILGTIKMVIGKGTKWGKKRLHKEREALETIHLRLVRKTLGLNIRLSEYVKSCHIQESKD